MAAAAAAGPPPPPAGWKNPNEPVNKEPSPRAMVAAARATAAMMSRAGKMPNEETAATGWPPAAAMPRGVAAVVALAAAASRDKTPRLPPVSPRYSTGVDQYYPEAPHHDLVG